MSEFMGPDRLKPVEDKKEEIKTKISEQLESIVADRKGSVSEASLSEYRKDTGKVLMDWGNLELVEEEIKQIEHNLDILSSLNGHQGSPIRKLIKSAKSSAGQYLEGLYDWSTRVAKNEGSLSDLLDPIPELLSQPGLTTEDIYERLVFKELHPEVTSLTYESAVSSTTAEILKLPRESKWINMVEPVFGSSRGPTVLPQILARVGFVPADLYTKKKFKSINPDEFINFIDELRALESSGAGSKAKAERAKALNYFISQGNAEKLRKKNYRHVSLDTNGLRLDFDNLHSHIPYGLIKNETMTALDKGNWIPQKQIDELYIRRASANVDLGNLRESRKSQLIYFAKEFGIAEKQNYVMILEKIRKLVIDDPDAFAQKILEVKTYIPDLFLERAVNESDPELLFCLFRVAETIAMFLSGDNKLDNKIKLINDPDYFNILRIIRAFLTKSFHPRPNKALEVFACDYKHDRNGTYYILKAVFEKEDVVQIVLNAEKNLDHIHKTNLQKLPRLSREQLKTASS